ncbi:MAG: DegT/DnrJ/EryC1/StrS family aminotransferase [Chloroflexota bacterium]
MSTIQQECEATVADVTGRRGALLTSRATTGLAATLRALHLPPGSRVMLPVMLCANVVHAIRAAHLQPLFVDILPACSGFGIDLHKAEDLARNDTNIKVLLIVPLFGGEISSKAQIDFAAQHGMIAIEDAAQSAPQSPTSINPQPRTIISIYSFGSGKIADAGGGGAIVTDDLNLLDQIKSELASTRDLSITAAAITKSLANLDTKQAERRNLAAEYRQRLNFAGIEHPAGELPLWKYSIVLGSKQQRDTITRSLLERGVAVTNLYTPLSRWFDHPHDWGKSQFPRAWVVSQRIINLPLWPPQEDRLQAVMAAFQAL